jgi:hypothetical protein
MQNGAEACDCPKQWVAPPHVRILVMRDCREELAWDVPP